MTRIDRALALLEEQNRLLKKLLDRQRVESRALLSSASAAKALGVRHSDVLAWIAEGRLRTVDVDGRERVPRAELERLQREGVPVGRPKKVANWGTLKGWKP